MDYRKLVWTIAGVLAIMAVVQAMTVIVSTEAEAAQKLGNSVSLVAGDCKIISTPKKIAATQTQISSGDYKTKFVLNYTKDGINNWKSRTIKTTTSNEAVLLSAIAKECDIIWAELQASNEKIDRVIIEPKMDSILNKAYNVLTKKWNDLGTT